MPLFKKKKQEVDERTELEKNLEEKGRLAGIKTAKFLQKAKTVVNKADEKLDGAFDKAVEKSKEVAKKGKEAAIKGKEALDKKRAEKEEVEVVE